MTDTEEWRNLSGCGFSLYEVSDQGRVRRIQPYNKGCSKPYVLKQSLTRHYYLQVSLYDGHANVKHCRVNRLVALTFLLDQRSNPDMEVHHINEDKQCNKVSNLMWLSHRDNCLASLHGRKVYQYSMAGELIKEYKFLKEAAYSIQSNPVTLRYQIIHQKPYKGYYWSFKNDNNFIKDKDK